MTKESATFDESDTILDNLSLGKQVNYRYSYSAELLQAVPRSLSRDQIGLVDPLPFSGADVWTGYELSWLNCKGKPQIAILRCEVPYDSPNLIESKSFKLYLNGFNQHKLESAAILEAILSHDLSQCAGKTVKVNLFTPEQFGQLQLGELEGECIDDLDIDVDQYDLQPDFLVTKDTAVKQTLTSNLLKSNCLITDQPDWGSVQIKYEGKQIDPEGLLRYLISFRLHNEFHEQCVERIFTDILLRCKPEKLSVLARYTRRGGLDINPFRSNFETIGSDKRNARQ